MANCAGQKKGEWEEITDYGGWGDTHYRCSVCGEEWHLDDGKPKDNNMNFCPRCGARMELKDGDIEGAIEELKAENAKLKELLKKAVEDFKKTGCFCGCSVCSKAIDEKYCFSKNFEWRYKEEAMKILKGEVNEDKNETEKAES